MSLNSLRITTSQLAKICGVSQGTVDRALNDRAGIHPETKKRIVEKAKEYGFRPSSGNQKQQEDLKQIGVVIFNLNNFYFAQLITEIEKSCRSAGYSVVVMMTNYDKSCEIESIKKLYRMGVEGIIVCPTNSGEAYFNFLHELGIPVVTVGNDIGYDGFCGIDDRRAMADMTKYVLEDGCRRVVYFSPAMKYEDAFAQKERLKGFLDATSEKEMEYKLCSSIDEVGEEDVPVICSTDYYALDVFFRRGNRRITGFDNISLVEKYDLPIDSVGSDISDIALQAVKMIREKQLRRCIMRHYRVKRWQ